MTQSLPAYQCVRSVGKRQWQPCAFTTVQKMGINIFEGGLLKRYVSDSDTFFLIISLT